MNEVPKFSERLSLSEKAWDAFREVVTPLSTPEIMPPYFLAAFSLGMQAQAERPIEVTDEMVERALKAWFGDAFGWTPLQVDAKEHSDGHLRSMRASLEAALGETE